MFSRALALLVLFVGAVWADDDDTVPVPIVNTMVELDDKNAVYILYSRVCLVSDPRKLELCDSRFETELRLVSRNKHDFEAMAPVLERLLQDSIPKKEPKLDAEARKEEEETFLQALVKAKQASHDAAEAVEGLKTDIGQMQADLETAVEKGHWPKQHSFSSAFMMAPVVIICLFALAYRAHEQRRQFRVQ